METTSFRCPCCGAALAFGASSQELECASCGNTFPLEGVEQAAEIHLEDTTDAQMHWNIPPERDMAAEAQGKLQAYRCETCGAQILADPAVAATECIYCGNPTVIPQVLTGIYRPDGVIPFKRTKREAQEAFRNHCSGKKLLPTGFYSDSRLEKITGVYVPFWLFECDAQADMTFNATRSITTREGQYMVTRTQHFLLHRSGQMSFDKVPADGAKNMDDTMMESVEPFDYRSIEDFQVAYLAGYQAQRHDVGAESCFARINERIRKSVQSIMGGTVAGYHTVVPAQTQIQLQNSRVKQVLMPVWLLNTRWKDQSYTFAMNGQTGQFIGDLPTDKGKFWKWMLSLAGGIGIGGCVLAFILFALGVL